MYSSGRQDILFLNHSIEIYAQNERIDANSEVFIRFASVTKTTI